MKILKPKPLQIGDTIGLLSVSGVLNDEKQAELRLAGKYLEKRGYKIVSSVTSCSQKDYLAGTDEQRIKVLENFFIDPHIDAIVATRGGYGTLRILERINYDIIKSNPKLFVGYSDITALLTMFHLRTGLVTFHGPMACADFGKEDVNLHTEWAFFEALTGRMTDIDLGENSIAFNPAVIEGTLFGGNLATFASLVGLDFFPERDIILMLEDINEPVYKIDRMMTQLFNTEKFKKCVKGIILGDFTAVDNVQWLQNFWEDFANRHKVPIATGLCMGHENKKLTIPFGITAQCNMYEGKITFTDTYCLSEIRN